MSRSIPLLARPLKTLVKQIKVDHDLLASALRESKRCALGRWAARGKQYLVQIRPLPEGGLVMQTLMYADEIRPFSEVGVEPGEVKPQELALAEQIIQQISTDEFKPENIRKKIEPTAGRPRYLLTVHGVGYRFADA